MFDTETEKSFHTLMTRNGIICDKISCHDKSLPTPDFLCKKNDLQAVFELKDLNESGTTEETSDGLVSQKITVARTVRRFIDECTKKFSNTKYGEYPSALVITNLRKFLSFQDILIPETERVLQWKLKDNPEIGNIIITGYNEPSNRMVAFHIYENPYSIRHIDRNFFMKINHKYYELNRCV